MKKQAILDELNELLNIPQVERIIFHKLEELRLYFQDEVKRYRELKEFFKKTAYGTMQIVEANDEMVNKEQMYHFELHYSEKGSWLITAIEPSPPPGFEICDIIPGKIVEYIGAFDTRPGKIENLEKLSLPTLKEKTFDLTFTKYSQWHVLGTIRVCKIPAAEATMDENPDRSPEIYYYDKKDAEKGDYQELFYYMQKYPPLRRYFFTEFQMKVKPLIVRNLVEITSSSQPVDLF